MTRPRSITIIGWWLIITGLWGAYISATLDTNPQAVALYAQHEGELRFQEVFGLINGIVTAGCGIGFLKGLWWSRLLFLGWGLMSILVGFFVMPTAAGLIFVGLALVLYFVALSLVCRRSANLWFEYCSQ